MKYTQWIGIVAAIIMVAACFMPWTYYPDIDQTFNGFYSYQNVYGRPGKAITVLAIICIIFFLIPRIWAKRWNIFFGVITLTYVLKTFILFSGCYRGICPTKLYGVWVTLVAAIVVLLGVLLPTGRTDK